MTDGEEYTANDYALRIALHRQLGQLGVIGSANVTYHGKTEEELNNFEITFHFQPLKVESVVEGTLKLEEKDSNGEKMKDVTCSKREFIILGPFGMKNWNSLDFHCAAINSPEMMAAMTIGLFYENKSNLAEKEENKKKYLQEKEKRRVCFPYLSWFYLFGLVLHVCPVLACLVWFCFVLFVCRNFCISLRKNDRIW